MRGELSMYSFVFVAVATICYFLTCCMRHFALHFGVLDHPNSPFKQHHTAVPYLGGGAIFLALLTGLWIIRLMHPSSSRMVVTLVASSACALLLGLLDDLKPLSPRVKLTGQALIGLTVVATGLRANLFGIVALDGLLTVLWLVGLTNAFNLIDVMDGLCTGIAAISSCFLTVILMWCREMELFALTLLLCGACIGFLAHNAPPATIYLGDMGSQFLGYLLGGVGVAAFFAKDSGTTGLIPVALLAVPIFEVIFLTVVRIRSGRSPMKASHDHTAHRLRRLGLRCEGVDVICYLFGTLFGVLALLMCRYLAFAPAFLALVLVVCLACGKKLAEVDMS